MLYSQKNKGVAVPEYEKEALNDLPGEKCIDIEIPPETSETVNSKHCAEVNSPYDLADIITDQRTVSSLSSNEKYGYLTIYYCPSEEEFLF